MKTIFLFLLFCIFRVSSFAGNVAGGDIGVNCISGLTEQFTITIWGDHFSSNDTLHIFYGDNTSSDYLNQSAFSFTSLAPNYPNDSEIKWVFTHTYSGPGTYTIGAIYTNRDTGISNIPNSENTTMYLAANLVVDPTIGCNNSPYLTNNHLIEWLPVSVNFSSNLGAIDPDGDSLVYSFTACTDGGTIIPGYTAPDVIGGGSFGVDAVTGDYYWNAPQILGRYNFVISIEEWKLFPNNQRYLVETVMREIQFNVGTGVGISEQNPFTFSCFPDPVSQNDELHLRFEKNGNYLIKLFDAEGKNVFENSFFCQKEQSINLPALSPGIYFLSVCDEDHLISSRKILIQNP